MRTASTPSPFRAKRRCCNIFQLLHITRQAVRGKQDAAAGVFACLLLLVLHVGLPAQSLQRYEYEHPQMGTLFRLTFYAAGDSLAAAAAAAAFRRIDSLNARLSDYLLDSELSRLATRAAEGPYVPVSEDLWRVLSKAQELAARSDGAFDISIGPLSKLWRRAFRRQTFPEAERLAEARSAVGYRHVELAPEHRSIRLGKAGMRLDAGGIAKGYAVDEAMACLHAAGIERALIDGGGDLLAAAPPPGQSGWRILLKTTDEQGRLRDSVILLRHSALATSGDTYRYLEWEGVRYSHIIDPRTGLGVQHRALISVCCTSCAEADALASAISVVGPSGDWRGLLREYRDCRARLLVPDARDHYRLLIE